MNGFWVAAFGIDGELEGTGFWELSRLSNDWVSFCQRLLNQNRASLNSPLEGKLSHIHVRLTAAGGAGLLTLSDSGVIASSVLLLSGASPEKELELSRLFIESLKRTTLARAAMKSEKPFEQVLQINQRPVIAVVPWPSESVDHELIKELEVHLSAAFFLHSLGP